MRRNALAPLLVVAALAAPLASAAVSSATTVSYGQAFSITGTAKATQGSPHVTVYGRPCGFNAFTLVAKPNLAADGRFAYKLAPTLNTEFRVFVNDHPTATVTVHVKPLIHVKHVRGATYRVEVTTGNGSGLAGHVVSLQRRSAPGHWKTMASAKLAAASRDDQIDAVAAATRAVRGSGQVRAVLSTSQAGPCFVGAASAPVS